MTLASAFLVSGSPLLCLRPQNRPWGRLADACKRAGRALAASHPEAIVMYSTQWLAVLDQLWQTAPRLQGVHVDENWHEYGELHYDLRSDTELAYACIASTARLGIRSKDVNYEGFPIDSGSITANALLNPQGRLPLVLTTNNVYHSAGQTEALGRLAVEKAHSLGRRVAVVGVGGLSGTLFRHEIDPARDAIASSQDDRWNRDILALMERGDEGELRARIPQYAAEAKVDMGFKHFYWLLGAMGGRWHGARVHGYGPTYGAGAAAVEFRL